MSRSQLTGETSSRASGTFSYGYDGGTSGGPGNPTSFKGTANSFNADNQVTGTGYGYDGNGSPTAYQGNSFTFDPENRPTSIGFQAPRYGRAYTPELFTYDGDGLRTNAKKQTPQQPNGVFYLKYWLYDGNQPVAEYDVFGNNSPTLYTTNTFGADGLVSEDNLGNGGSTFYLFDERGNVSQRTSSTGSVLSSDLYDAYGSCTTSSGVVNADEWGYEGQAGYQTDDQTGLILCTHRYYDPSTGRWLTRDPMGYDGGINLYEYVGNDPGNRVDPNGYNGLGDGIGNIGSGLAGAGVGWAANPGNYVPGPGLYTGPTPIISWNPPPPGSTILPHGPPVTIYWPFPLPVSPPGPIGQGCAAVGVVLMFLGGVINLF